jgi:hypothetical protein
VDREDDQHVRLGPGDLRDRPADAGVPFAPGLAAVRCDHDDAPRIVVEVGERGVAVATGQLGRAQQRVDDGVAGDENVLRFDVLGEQVALVPLGGCEVERREPRRQRAVDLLGER